MAYLVLPHAHRWLRLRQLTSSDVSKQQQALHYIVQSAATNDRVVSGVARQMRLADHNTFLKIFEAVSSCNVAGDRRVIESVCDRLAYANQEAFLQIAELLDAIREWRYDSIGDDLWLQWLNILARDEGVESRILAAQHAADLPDLASDPRVASLLELLIGDPAQDVRYNGLVAIAELAGFLDKGELRQHYKSFVFALTDDIAPVIAAQAWIILGLLDPIGSFEADWQNYHPLVAKAILWSMLQTDPDYPNSAIEALDDMSVDPSIREIAKTLLQSGKIDEASVPDNFVTSQTFYETLVSNESVIRDWACVVAADHFVPIDNESLIKSLLTDFNDNAKMSGAILAGLTGLHRDLLIKKIADEDIWSVRQIMRLGQWMQGSALSRKTSVHLNSDMTNQAADLLIRGDLPRSTVLLALLHQHDPTALDYLLNPRGEPTVDLVELLVEYRWWRVLKRYLPNDAPPLSFSMSSDLQSFQVDVLRNWYLVNHHRIIREHSATTNSD